MDNGNLILPPFRAEDYNQEVHAQTYRCIAENTFGKIISRDVHVRAGTAEQIFFLYYTIWRKIWMQRTFWRNFAWNSIGISFSPKNLNHAACIAAPQCTKRRYLMQTNWIERNSNVYNIRFCAIWSIFVNSKNSTLIANWHAFVSVSDKIFRQIARRYYSLVKIGLTVCQNDQYSFFKRVCRFT